MGGIEAEAVMLGQPISMVLPEVVGYRLTGTADKLITSTDIVLTVTKVGDGVLVTSGVSPGPLEWVLVHWRG